MQMALEHAPTRIRKIGVSSSAKSKLGKIPSNTRLVEMESEELDEFVDEGVRHGGVVAWVQKPNTPSLKDLAEHARERRGPILVLDGVTDPRNLGAILRNALWFDVPALIVPKRNTAQLTSAAVKASSGAACIVPIVQVPNLARALDALKEADIWIYAAAKNEGSSSFSKAPLNHPAALVMGDEGRGIRPNVANRADVQIHIPGDSRPEFDSLNVSVAAGILLSAFYELSDD